MIEGEGYQRLGEPEGAVARSYQGGEPSSAIGPPNGLTVHPRGYQTIHDVTQSDPYGQVATEFAIFKDDHGMSDKRTRQLKRRCLIVGLIFAIITAGLWGGYAGAKSADTHSDTDDCVQRPWRYRNGCPDSPLVIGFLVSGVIISTFFFVFGLSAWLVLCCRSCTMRDVENGDYVFWTVRGEAWKRFVEQYYGPESKESNGAICFCLRKKSYRKLLARDTGRYLVGPSGFCLEGGGLFPINPFQCHLLLVRLFRNNSGDRVLELTLKLTNKHSTPFKRFIPVPEEITDWEASSFFNRLAAETGSNRNYNGLNPLAIRAQ